MNEPYRTEVINFIKDYYLPKETKYINSFDVNKLAQMYSDIGASCSNCPYHLSMSCDGIKEADYDFGGYHSCEDVVKIVLTDSIYS